MPAAAAAGEVAADLFHFVLVISHSVVVVAEEGSVVVAVAVQLNSAAQFVVVAGPVVQH